MEQDLRQQDEHGFRVRQHGIGLGHEGQADNAGRHSADDRDDHPGHADIARGGNGTMMCGWPK